MLLIPLGETEHVPTFEEMLNFINLCNRCSL